MKHFAEARSDARAAMRGDAGLRSRVDGICLIWDVRGKLRCLLKAKPGEDLGSLKGTAVRLCGEAAGGFWSGQVWLWSEQTGAPERAVYEAAWREATLVDSGPPELKTLDRHLSKSAWFAPPLREPWPLNERTPPVLSFFSFKGGVGRTTALASMAIQLSRSHRSVVLIDLDLEAPGIAAILPGAGGQTATHGVVDYLLERSLLPPEEIDLGDYYYLVDDPAIVGDGPPITVIPAGVLDSEYLEKLARIDYDVLYQPPQDEPRSTQPLLELLREIRRKRNPEYILLDSRSGLHDLGGLALSGVSHLDVLFGLDSDQSWRGMEAVVRFLGRDRVERNQRQLPAALVFTMAPEAGAMRDEARQRFLERAYELFSHDYYDEPDADPQEASPLPGIEDTVQPHYPALLGFDPTVQRYRSIADVADRLATGDFSELAEAILNRVGRTLR